MPDKRQPVAEGTESPDTLINAVTLIARREGTVKENFTGSGGTGDTANSGADLSAQNADWAEDNDIPLNAIVEAERIRRQYREQYRRLTAFVGEYTELQIVRGIIEHRLGVTYDTLEQYVDVSRRTLKEHVGTLVDFGVVEREGNPAQIRFVDEDRELLAAEATAMWDID